jgi:2,4-dienoyl-CoA reductase-like NADH-dependent reductase (Old Yellow Enzyme family)
MSSLFDPLTLRGMRLRNRIAVSPMCQYSSTDGFASDWHLVHLGARAVGGAGLVLTEATAVTPQGRISPRDLGIWTDEHLDGLSRIARFLKEQGAATGVQLAHAGRKASHAPPFEGGHRLLPEEGGWREVYAPSPVSHRDGAPAPVELSLAEIAGVVEAFARGAARAVEAGFESVELHFAHGYLVHEFLSGLANHRTDAYGGNFKGRTRMALEILEAVRNRIPDAVPVLVRLSATDWVDDPAAWTIEQTVELSRRLAVAGADLIDCSSGGVSTAQTVDAGPGYNTAFAARVRGDVGIPTGAVGGITAAAQAEHIIRTGQADLVLLARELLRRPHFPLEAAGELGRDVEWPKQYRRARPR